MGNSCWEFSQYCNDYNCLDTISLTIISLTLKTFWNLHELLKEIPFIFLSTCYRAVWLWLMWTKLASNYSHLNTGQHPVQRGFGTHGLGFELLTFWLEDNWRRVAATSYPKTRGHHLALRHVQITVSVFSTWISSRIRSSWRMQPWIHSIWETVERLNNILM